MEFDPQERRRQRREKAEKRWQKRKQLLIRLGIGAAILANAEKIVNNDGTTSFIPNENIFLGAFLAGLAVFAVLVPMLRKEKSYA